MSLFCFIRLLLSPVLLEISGNRFDWKYFHSWISFCLFWVFFFFLRFAVKFLQSLWHRNKMKWRPFKSRVKVTNCSLGQGVKKKKITCCPSLHLRLPSGLVIISTRLVFSFGETWGQLRSSAPRLGTDTFHGRSAAQCLNWHLVGGLWWRWKWAAPEILMFKKLFNDSPLPSRSSTKA